MADEFRRPRTLAVARAVVYLTAAVAWLALFALTLGFLAAMGLLGILSVALFDTANTLVVFAFGVFGLLVSGVVAFALLEAVRRADRWLVETARQPDPVEEVTASYVSGHVDEAALEREIERVLASASDAERAGEPRVTLQLDDEPAPSYDRLASERR